MNNPFLRRPPNKKRKEPRRVIGREILRGKSKTDRRKEIFERSGGKCEDNVLWVGFNWKGESISSWKRCNAEITWETMEWSHKRHGPNKTDELKGGIASCRDCHRKRHSSTFNRRPGKVMKIKQAEEYWNGVVCFCDGEKKARESFCATCRAKLSPQIAHDLENADDPDTYRETLALAENEILMWREDNK